MKPGWNDPPSLKYKVHQETTTRRNVLNKRLSYLDQPQSSQNSVRSLALNPGLPPPTSMMPPKCAKSPDVAVGKPSAQEPATEEGVDDWVASLRKLAANCVS